MKRVIFIVLAALVVLLGYPSVTLYAGTAKSDLSGPSILTGSGNAKDDSGIALSEDGGGDDGDADGLGGIKNRLGGGAFGEGVTSSDPRVNVYVQVWWKFMMLFVR